MLAVAFLLGPWMEARYASSVGKMAFECQVVRLDGAPPRWRDALLRFLLRFPLVFVVFVPPQHFIWYTIPVAAQAFAASVGMLWYFFADGRTLWDKLTGTRVVHGPPEFPRRLP